MVVWDVGTVHGYTVECRWDVFNLWLFGMFVPYSSMGCLYRLAVCGSLYRLVVGDICTVFKYAIIVPFPVWVICTALLYVLYYLVV